LYACPLNDNGTTKATTVLTLGGTATAAGTFFLYVNDLQIQIPVSLGDTPTVVGTNIASSITANPLLPVTAVNVTGVVTFTSKNAGTLGNGILIQANYLGTLNNEYLPAGLTAAFAAGVTGATDPALSTALANLGSIAYEYIIQPYTDSTSLTALQTFSAGRWNANSQLFGHCFTAYKGTVAALVTLGSALNDPHNTVVGYYGSPTWSIEVAAAAGAEAANSLNIDPSLPLQTVALSTVMVPLQSYWFTQSNLQTLLSNGITPLNYVGGVARFVDLISTYQFNSYGQPDQSYYHVTTQSTNAAIARSVASMILQKFPRSKLAIDGTVAGPMSNVVTPSDIKVEIISLYALWLYNGWVQDVADFVANLVVVIDVNNPNRVDILLPPYLVGSLQVTAIQNQFRLNIGITTA
jgi:phage tail sheath gpL-like